MFRDHDQIHTIFLVWFPTLCLTHPILLLDSGGGEGKVPLFPECPLLSFPGLWASRLRPHLDSVLHFRDTLHVLRETYYGAFISFSTPYVPFPGVTLQPTRSQSGTEAGILELKWEDKRTYLFSLTIGWNSVFPSILNEGNQQGNSRWYTQCISLLCIRWLLIKDSQIFSYHIIVVAAIVKYLCSSLLQNLMVVSSLARICYFIF